MKVNELQAIDVHGHYGTYVSHKPSIRDGFMSADGSQVTQRASRAGIQYTLVSPMRGLLPRGQADAAAGNREAAAVISRFPQLRQWVVVDPRQEETFKQAQEILIWPQAIGIKIHPEEHDYPIKEWGDKIFRWAAEHRTVISTHSGEANSLPEDFVPFANAYPEVKLILAHLGCGYDDDPTHQVRAVQQSKNNNIWIDTSSSSSIYAGLIEWAVREVGAPRLLFGTDTPIHSVAAQRARIEGAEISETDKCLILRENALTLWHF